METGSNKKSGSHPSHQIPIRIPIIDLFAGPGGLGEGFSACRDQDGGPRFHVALSIEKEEHAHKTLELRAFFRQFERGRIPSEYYSYLRGRSLEKIFSMLFPGKASQPLLWPGMQNLAIRTWDQGMSTDEYGLQ